MNPRLNRLFGPDGRCFDVAVDHGLFGEESFLAGIEDMPRVVATLVDARPDAIQLSPGQAPLLQGIRDPDKPVLVLRTDVANVYGTDNSRHYYSHCFDDVVMRAVRLDAACVVVNLLLLPDEPELLGACVRNVMSIRASCDHFGMPLMVEPLVMKSGSSRYEVDGDPSKIVSLVRQATELGADVIKADPTTDLSDYHLVVEAAGGCPLLVRGGGRVTDEEILRRTKTVIESGASGIVYGRNVIQHRNPAGITRALMAVVHEGATIEAAMRMLDD